MQLLILSLLVASALGAPVVLTPVGNVGVPTLLTTGQLIQQPAFFTQEAAQVAAAPAVQDTIISDQFSLRDPSNPTTDVVFHGGFPFVSASLAAPSAIQAQPLTATRVGISTLGTGVQTAHVAAVQPATTPAPFFQPQVQQSAFASLPLTSLQSPSQSAAFLIPAPQAQTQQVASAPAVSGIRTIPITLTGPFQLTAN